MLYDKDDHAVMPVYVISCGDSILKSRQTSLEAQRRNSSLRPLLRLTRLTISSLCSRHAHIWFRLEGRNSEGSSGFSSRILRMQSSALSNTELLKNSHTSPSRSFCGTPPLLGVTCCQVHVTLFDGTFPLLKDVQSRCSIRVFKTMLLMIHSK